MPDWVVLDQYISALAISGQRGRWVLLSDRARYDARPVQTLLMRILFSPLVIAMDGDWVIR